jgi:poly(U)-specific endoribonuclease
METVSDEEIEDMTESLLFWEEESLRAELDINLQEQTNATSCENKPSLGSLLKFKNGTPGKFTTTIENLISLYNDFNPNTAVEEMFTPAKPLEQLYLSSSIMDTRLMKAVINFLIAKNFVPRETVFQRKFYTMWFDTYQRSENAAMDSSSGFEHVFLGEIDPEEGAIGFHNWLYLMNEDSERNISYNGYIKYLELNEKASVILINFKWRDNCKPQSSMFLGTTPEFEFALYTLCWFTRPNRLCPVLLGGKRFSVQTYVKVNHYGDKLVSTAYPVMSGTNYTSSSISVLGAALLFFYFTKT